MLTEKTKNKTTTNLKFKLWLVFFYGFFLTLIYVGVKSVNNVVITGGQQGLSHTVHVSILIYQWKNVACPLATKDAVSHSAITWEATWQQSLWGNSGWKQMPTISRCSRLPAELVNCVSSPAQALVSYLTKIRKHGEEWGQTSCI